MPNPGFIHGLSMQLRVIWALCLREIHGKHGKSRLGYLWVIFKTVFGVAVFWWVRTLGGMSTPHGMPLPLFLVMGFIPWHIFSGCLRMVMEAVKTNKALLTFPQVMPLDLYISSGIVVWVTEVLVMLLFILALDLAGYQFFLYDPITLFSMMLLLGFFSFGLGLSLSVIALYLPALEQIVPMVLRILFFASGIFFSPSQIGGKYASLLYWNPLLNVIEACRGAFAVRHPAPEIRIGYVIILTCLFLAFGLLLERYVRFKQTA